MRNRTEVAVKSASYSSDQQFEGHNEYGRGAVIVINPTAGAGSVVVKVQGLDPGSNTTWDILTSASVAGTTPVVLRIYPGLTPAANLIVSDLLPPNYRVLATVTSTLTFSIGVSLVE